MFTPIAQTGIAPTMFWVYAATALLIVLFVLLTAPYFGVFGEKDTDLESDHSESAEGS